MSFSDDGLDDYKSGPQHSTPIKTFDQARSHTKPASNIPIRQAKRAPHPHPPRHYPSGSSSCRYSQQKQHNQELHHQPQEKQYDKIQKLTTQPNANSTLTLEEISAIEGSFMRVAPDGLVTPPHVSKTSSFYCDTVLNVIDTKAQIGHYSPEYNDHITPNNYRHNYITNDKPDTYLQSNPLIQSLVSQNNNEDMVPNTRNQNHLTNVKQSTHIQSNPPHTQTQSIVSHDNEEIIAPNSHRQNYVTHVHVKPNTHPQTQSIVSQNDFDSQKHITPSHSTVNTQPQTDTQAHTNMTWAKYLLNTKQPSEYSDRDKLDLYNLQCQPWGVDTPRFRDSEDSSDKVNSPVEMTLEGRSRWPDMYLYTQGRDTYHNAHETHSSSSMPQFLGNSFSQRQNNNNVTMTEQMSDQSAVFALSDPKKNAAHIEQDVISKQRREIHLLMEELGTRDRELNDLVRSHKSQVAQWGKDRDRMGELQHRLKEYEEELEKNDVQLRDTMTEMSQVSKQKEAEGKELTLTQMRLKEVEERTEEEMARTHKIETENHHLKESVRELTAIRHQMEAREADLESQIRDKDKVISECRKSEDVVTDEVKRLKVTLEQTQEKLVNTDAEGQAWRRKFCQAQDMADKLAAEASSKEETVGRMSQQLHESLQQAIALQKALFTSGEREKCKEEVLHSIRRQQNRTMQELSNLRMLYDRQNKDLTLYHLSVREKESKHGRRLRCKSWDKHSGDRRETKHRRQRSMSDGKHKSESFLVKRGWSSSRDRTRSSSNEASLDRSHARINQSQSTPERQGRKENRSQGSSSVKSCNAATSMSNDQMPSGMGLRDGVRPVKVSPTAAPSTSNESDTLRAQLSLPYLSNLDHRHAETSSKLPQAFTKSEPQHNSKGHFSDTSSSRGSSPDKHGHYDGIQSADSDGMCPELRRNVVSSFREVHSSSHAPSTVLGNLPAQLEATVQRASFLRKDVLGHMGGSGPQGKENGGEIKVHTNNGDTLKVHSNNVMTDAERIKLALSSHSGGDTYLDKKGDEKGCQRSRQTDVQLQSGDSYFVSEDPNHHQPKEDSINKRDTTGMSNSPRDHYQQGLSDSEDMSIFEDKSHATKELRHRRKQVNSRLKEDLIPSQTAIRIKDTERRVSLSSDSFDEKSVASFRQAIKDPNHKKIFKSKVHNSNSFPNEASLSPKQPSSNNLLPNSSDGNLSMRTSLTNQRANKGRPGFGHLSQRSNASGDRKFSQPNSYDRYRRDDSGVSERLISPVDVRTANDRNQSQSSGIDSPSRPASNNLNTHRAMSKSPEPYPNLTTIMRKPELSVSLNERSDLKKKCLRFSSVQQSISPDRGVSPVSDSTSISENCSSLSSHFKDKSSLKNHQIKSSNKKPHCKMVQHSEHSQKNASDSISHQSKQVVKQDIKTHQHFNVPSSHASSHPHNHNSQLCSQDQSVLSDGSLKETKTLINIDTPNKPVREQGVRASWSGSSRGSQSERSTKSQSERSTRRGCQSERTTQVRPYFYEEANTSDSGLNNSPKSQGFSKDYFFMKSDRRSTLSSSPTPKYSPSTMRVKPMRVGSEGCDQEDPFNRENVLDPLENSNNNNIDEMHLNLEDNLLFMSDEPQNVSSGSVNLHFNRNNSLSMMDRSVDINEQKSLDNLENQDSFRKGSGFDDLNKLDNEEHRSLGCSQSRPFCVARGPSLYNQLSRIHYCEKSKRYEWVGVQLSGDGTGSENTSQCLGDCSIEPYDQDSATPVPDYIQNLSLDSSPEVIDNRQAQFPPKAPSRSLQYLARQVCTHDECDSDGQEKPSFLSPETRVLASQRVQAEGLQPVVKKLNFSLTFEETDDDMSQRSLNNINQSSPSDVRLRFSKQMKSNSAQSETQSIDDQRRIQRVQHSYDQSFDDISNQDNINLGPIRDHTWVDVEIVSPHHNGRHHPTDTNHQLSPPLKNVSENYHVNLPDYNSNKSLELHRKTINLTEYFKDISGIELEDDNEDSAFKDMVDQVEEIDEDSNEKTSNKDLLISEVKNINANDSFEDPFRSRSTESYECTKEKALSVLEHSELVATQTSQLLRFSSAEFLSLDLGSSHARLKENSTLEEQKDPVLQKEDDTVAISWSQKQSLYSHTETPRLEASGGHAMEALNMTSFLEEPSVDTPNTSSLQVAMSPATKLHRLLLDSQEMVRRLEGASGIPVAHTPQTHY